MSSSWLEHEDNGYVTICNRWLCYCLWQCQTLQSVPKTTCFNTRVMHFLATDIKYSLFLSNINQRNTVIKTLHARTFEEDAFLPQITNTFVPVKRKQMQI